MKIGHKREDYFEFFSTDYTLPLWREIKKKSQLCGQPAGGRGGRPLGRPVGLFSRDKENGRLHPRQHTMGLSNSG